MFVLLLAETVPCLYIRMVQKMLLLNLLNLMAHLLDRGWQFCCLLVEICYFFICLLLSKSPWEKFSALKMLLNRDKDCNETLMKNVFLTPSCCQCPHWSHSHFLSWLHNRNWRKISAIRTLAEIKTRPSDTIFIATRKKRYCTRRSVKPNYAFNN